MQVLTFYDNPVAKDGLVLIDGAFYLARTLAILSVLHSFRA